MRILTVSTFFPNSANPHRTVFVKNLVRAMQARCTLSVVAPMPYVPAIPQLPHWYAQSRIGRREDVDGIEVLHPRFLVLPRMHWCSGLTYFLGVVSLLRQVKHDHGACLIHVHCAYPDGVGVALAARVLRLPFVITVHGSDINVYAAQRVLKPQIRWALGAANGVIAVSSDLEDKVRRLTYGSVKRLVCIPCAGFDPAMFFPRPLADCRAARDLPPGARIVVFVGNLVPIKGVEFLVEAWALLSRRGILGDEDRLVIVGEGRCRTELERCAEAAGIGPRVKFTGAIPQIEVSCWVAAASLLCLPSHNEGMPNVVVEALATGIPVVSTRVGGIPELIREGVNGLLVAPGKSGVLADALAAAMTRSWDRNEIRSSVAHLTWQALADRNCEFLDSVVSEAKRASAS